MEAITINTQWWERVQQLQPDAIDKVMATVEKMNHELMSMVEDYEKKSEACRQYDEQLALAYRIREHVANKIYILAEDFGLGANPDVIVESLCGASRKAELVAYRCMITAMCLEAGIDNKAIAFTLRRDRSFAHWAARSHADRMVVDLDYKKKFLKWQKSIG